MNDPQTNAETQAAELSPESRAILKRARRSFAITMGLLLAGFMVIAGVLVYRSSQGDGGASARYALGAVAIPTGAELVSAVASDGNVTLTYRNGALTAIRIIDGKTGDILRELVVGSD